MGWTVNELEEKRDQACYLSWPSKNDREKSKGVLCVWVGFSSHGSASCGREEKFGVAGRIRDDRGLDNLL